MPSTSNAAGRNCSTRPLTLSALRIFEAALAVRASSVPASYIKGLSPVSKGSDERRQGVAVFECACTYGKLERIIAAMIRTGATLFVPVGLCVASIALVAGCGDSHGNARTSAKVCAAHFADVHVTRDTTVGKIRFVGGPRPTGKHIPEALDKYPDNTRAVLCLVPTSSKIYDVVAIIPQDGFTLVRWRQSPSDTFIPVS
jgi:hypothetical protein